MKTNENTPITNDKSPLGYTVNGIIGMAGGSTAVSKEVGVSVQSIRKWRYIPEWHARTVAIMAGLPLEIVRPDMVQRGHALALQKHPALA